MTITQKLAKLNQLRTIFNMPTIKSWKKSAELLDAKIGELNAKLKANPDLEERKTLLARLNEYKAVMGYPQVTDWFGSNDELKAAITSIKAEHLLMIKSEEEHARKTAKKKSISIPSLAKVTKNDTKAPKKAEASKKVVVNTSKPSNSVLPGIASELGINAKVARQKLRKLHGSAWRNLSAKEIRASLTK